MTRTDFANWERADGPPELDQAMVIFWNGFEPRSTKLLRSSRLENVHRILGFRFADNQFDLSENDRQISAVAPPDRYETRSCDRRNQFSTYKTFFEIFSSLDREVRIVFDITCFPRDVLLIALYALKKTNRFADALCTYNLAQDYSIGTPDGQEKWLSKGVSSVSPLIGYRGVVSPDKPMQLIALVGFDDQRLLQIAEILCPDSVVFAYGDTKLTDRDWLIQQSHQAVDELISRFDDTRKESFVCEEGQSVFNLIDKATAERPDHNQIVVPMNNKISTLFTGAYCLANRNVQICYGGGLIYNHSHYSLESETFFSWKLSS
ncbi:hypothetical protein [Ruegeria sp. HKCCD8929]|uniref:hypothetical protein n=1 Tax=Ruegeria sp. HKCCD8929 TaxID=2683006 RepID=UPI0014886F32|nr:hypothetical protein [Ruegeria sp. HKCCD8929]